MMVNLDSSSAVVVLQPAVALQSGAISNLFNFEGFCDTVGGIMYPYLAHPDCRVSFFYCIIASVASRVSLTPAQQHGENKELHPAWVRTSHPIQRQFFSLNESQSISCTIQRGREHAPRKHAWTHTFEYWKSKIEKNKIKR